MRPEGLALHQENRDSPTRQCTNRVVRRDVPLKGAPLKGRTHQRGAPLKGRYPSRVRSSRRERSERREMRRSERGTPKGSEARFPFHSSCAQFSVCMLRTRFVPVTKLLGRLFSPLYSSDAKYMHFPLGAAVFYPFFPR